MKVIQRTDVFYLEYTDELTGDRITRRVVGSRVAQQLGRTIAMASGKRVLVRRGGPRDDLYDVLIYDLSNGGSTSVSINGVTKEVATEMFRHWNARIEKAVCVMWPNWAPKPQISI